MKHLAKFCDVIDLLSEPVLGSGCGTIFLHRKHFLKIVTDGTKEKKKKKKELAK